MANNAQPMQMMGGMSQLMQGMSQMGQVGGMSQLSGMPMQTMQPQQQQLSLPNNLQAGMQLPVNMMLAHAKQGPGSRSKNYAAKAAARPGARKTKACTSVEYGAAYRSFGDLPLDDHYNLEERVNPVDLNRTRIGNEPKYVMNALSFHNHGVLANNILWYRHKEQNINTCLMEHAARQYPSRNMTVMQIVAKVKDAYGTAPFIQYTLGDLADGRQFLSNQVNAVVINPSPSGQKWSLNVLKPEEAGTLPKVIIIDPMQNGHAAAEILPAPSWDDLQRAVQEAAATNNNPLAAQLQMMQAVPGTAGGMMNPGSAHPFAQQLMLQNCPAHNSYETTPLGMTMMQPMQGNAMGMPMPGGLGMTQGGPGMTQGVPMLSLSSGSSNDHLQNAFTNIVPTPNASPFGSPTGSPMGSPRTAVPTAPNQGAFADSSLKECRKPIPPPSHDRKEGQYDESGVQLSKSKAGDMWLIDFETGTRGKIGVLQPDDVEICENELGWKYVVSHTDKLNTEWVANLMDLPRIDVLETPAKKAKTKDDAVELEATEANVEIVKLNSQESMDQPSPSTETGESPAAAVKAQTKSKAQPKQIALTFNKLELPTP